MSRDVLILIIIRMMIQFQFYTGLEAKNSDSSKAQELATILPCGQYGFRCIDRTSYQVCSIDISDDDDDYIITPQPEPVYECGEGLVCDEDNPAFCTPMDVAFIFTTKSNNNHIKDTLLLNEENYENENNVNDNSDYDRDDGDDYYYEFNEIKRPERYLHSKSKYENCECTETTTFTPVTIETTTEAYFTTMTFTTEAAYDCDQYGFFPDYGNKSRFWYCDVPVNGEGYLLRHMVCSASRIFDPVRRTCILPGTIRHKAYDLNDLNTRNRRKNRENFYQKFNCDNKTPGKYPDENNCLNYYFCVPNTLLPIKEVLFTCPENTAYDLIKRKCTPQAYYPCIGLQYSNDDNNYWKKNSKYNSNINCVTPLRSRDIRDCSRYYLCYGNRVFEIKCPDSYKFDDNKVECVPRAIATCTEIFN